MMRMFWAVVLSVVAFGVHAESFSVPEHLEGEPYVQVSNGDGISGRVARIYASDILIFEAWESGATIEGETLSLRPGAYVRLRAQAVALIAVTDGSPERDIPCQDYGVDVIAVVENDALVARVLASCPMDDVFAAQDALRAEIEAEAVR